MGVDYCATFGIGYEVEASENFSEEDLEYGLEEYLDSVCGESFMCIKKGNAYYGEYTHYLVLVDPFKCGLDLTKSKKELDDEVKRLNLEVCSEFGLVGGLYSY